MEPKPIQAEVIGKKIILKMLKNEADVKFVHTLLYSKWNKDLTQPEHHKKQSFRDEYLLLLKKSEIDFDSKYLFEWYE